MFITNHQAAEVLEPGEEALDFPAPAVATERATVLGSVFPIAAVGSDQFDAQGSQCAVQFVRVVRVVTNEPRLPFWPPGRHLLYSKPVPLFLSFLSSGPGRLRQPTKGPPMAPPVAQKPGSASFQTFFQTPVRLLPVRSACFPAAAYPVGTASAAIRRTMLTNSRRVRWLSARSSQ